MSNPMTEAERRDWLVRQGAERYVTTFLSVMKYMSRGGRTPGITVPSRDELLRIYTNTTPAYWDTLARELPEEAQSQLAEFKRVWPKGKEQ